MVRKAYQRVLIGDAREIPLEVALAPQAWTDYGSGVVEDAQAQAEENAKAIGALAALLVEKGVLSLDEVKDAYRIGDVYFEEDI